MYRLETMLFCAWVLWVWGQAEYCLPESAAAPEAVQCVTRYIAPRRVFDYEESKSACQARTRDAILQVLQEDFPELEGGRVRENHAISTRCLPVGIHPKE